MIGIAGREFRECGAVAGGCAGGMVSGGYDWGREDPSGFALRMTGGGEDPSGFALRMTGGGEDPS
ncbi:hypothetical protein EBZ80_21715, partial [bacterium]|nr:hypothetical protein [bacterium]